MDYTKLNKSNYDKLNNTKKTRYDIKRDEWLLIREINRSVATLKQLDSLITKLNNTISGD
tara:strand:- start:513 stop:692 length:180 start_codon:yes stop_codon:yes gene_type:complete